MSLEKCLLAREDGLCWFVPALCGPLSVTFHYTICRSSQRLDALVCRIAAFGLYRLYFNRRGGSAKDSLANGKKRRLSSPSPSIHSPEKKRLHSDVREV